MPGRVSAIVPSGVPTYSSPRAAPYPRGGFSSRFPSRDDIAPLARIVDRMAGRLSHRGFHSVMTDFIYPVRKSETQVDRSARTSLLPALRQRAGGEIRACPRQATMVVSAMPISLLLHIVDRGRVARIFPTVGAASG